MQDPTTPGPTTKRTASRMLLVASTILLVFACALTGGSGRDVPPQEWNASRGPVVPHDKFPTDCSLCHEGTGWSSIKQGFRFDHAKETGVVLAGAHARAECLRCHNDRGPVALFAERGCVGCHEDVHRARLGANCADCHGEGDWRPKDQIAKHARTRFPLVGAHAAAECSRCHPGAHVANFDATSTRCEDCHQDDLARATSPDHAAQGWTSSCDRCHIPTSWTGAGFNHPMFPLNGAHAGLDCTQCHLGGDFSGAPNTCVGCHQSDYDATSRPPHTDAGFGTTCQNCHSTAAWTPARFNHNAFPLTGAHRSAACSACHSGGVYRGLPENCSACHQSDYDATTAPNHASSGFPTTCEQCHNTVAWTRANFSHTGVTRNCVQCHQVDYDATTNPNHAAAGFPTSCQNCHGTNTWDGASFTHTQFPIASGAHAGFDCAQCHQNPRNFNQFTCTSCHEHDQQTTDNDHDRVPGYVYTSSACYACHPDGND